MMRRGQKTDFWGKLTFRERIEENQKGKEKKKRERKKGKQRGNNPRDRIRTERVGETRRTGSG